MLVFTDSKFSNIHLIFNLVSLVHEITKNWIILLKVSEVNSRVTIRASIIMAIPGGYNPKFHFSIRQFWETSKDRIILGQFPLPVLRCAERSVWSSCYPSWRPQAMDRDCSKFQLTAKSFRFLTFKSFCFKTEALF